MQQPLKENKFVISKSRYDSIDSYLSECSAKYNDIPLVLDITIYEQLRADGTLALLSIPSWSFLDLKLTTLELFVIYSFKASIML